MNNDRQCIHKLEKLLSFPGLVPSCGWENIEKFFIVSTGRTGTKFLVKFFENYPEIFTRHEPFPDFRILSIDYTRGKSSYPRAVRLIEKHRRAYGRESERRNAKIYLESNNRLFSLTKPLKEVFDDAKIIYIVRDGRDYVRSGLSRGWYGPDDRKYRLSAEYFKDDPYFSKWAEMSRFEKVCWRWQKKNGYIYNDIQQMENVITVKFEDIFSCAEYSGMRRIIDFIGVDKEVSEKLLDRMMTSKVNVNKEYNVSKWQNWTEEEKGIFDEICGDHMKEFYNYSW